MSKCPMRMSRAVQQLTWFELLFRMQGQVLPSWTEWRQTRRRQRRLCTALKKDIVKRLRQAKAQPFDAGCTERECDVPLKCANASCNYRINEDHRTKGLAKLQRRACEHLPSKRTEIRQLHHCAQSLHPWHTPQCRTTWCWHCPLLGCDVEACPTC